LQLRRARVAGKAIDARASSSARKRTRHLLEKPGWLFQQIFKKW